MKQTLLLSCFLILASALKLFAARNDAVSVRIFSKYHLKHASVEGEFLIGDTKDKVARCAFYAKQNTVFAKCRNKAIKNNLIQISNIKEGLDVKAGKIKRSYRGSLSIYAETGELILINRVTVDDYLRGVLGSEMPFLKTEALKAQAVVSRTWVYKNRHKRHESYDFCDLTHCQVYKGKSEEGKVFSESVYKTNGMILALQDNSSPAEVFYHSTCGGRTTNQISGKPALSLSLVKDPYCVLSPHANWEFFIMKKTMNKLFHKSIKDISITKRDAAGRALSITLKTGSSVTHVSAQAFYHALGKGIGWNKLKSTWFEVSKTQEAFVFKGHGLGHGAGLCQWGAYLMAKEGKNYADILKFYFPKLHIVHETKN